MRKWFLAAAMLLAFTGLRGQTIHSIDIGVGLGEDGTLYITQLWDVTVVSGTEWYIPIENLDAADVTDLRVYENGVEFENDGRSWNTKRSRDEKAGRCGIVDKGRNGVELCWGQGDYGRHVWKATFAVHGVVTSLKDYDAFNFMFINVDLPSPPEFASIIFKKTSGVPLNAENTRFWFFGCSGNSKMQEDGSIYFETDSKIYSNQSLIAMMRFDKGVFSPERSKNIAFEKMQKKAFKGSDYKSKGGGMSFSDLISYVFGILFIGAIVLGIVGFIFLILRDIFLRIIGRVWSPKTFGSAKPSGWQREPPFDGSITKASALLFDGGRLWLTPIHSERAVGAYFLKWIKDGIVKPVKQPASDEMNLEFPEEAPQFEDNCETNLFKMAIEAAGSNKILEPKEFSKWSEKHYTRVLHWPDTVIAAGKSALAPYALKKGKLELNEEGRAEACKLLQFKNFLSDFTLSDERSAPEVQLWGEYLIFAQLFGIADKVQKGLAKLYPSEYAMFSESYGMEGSQMTGFLSTWSGIGHTIERSASSAKISHEGSSSSGSSGGFGGRSSIGGGGGFSGGGHGGGSR
ncbi:MAG: DUF2207 domain-containing protein [Bacteroidales bacterium]|nr:DUF2207 domain-containing protein [Bacteroidales bacterium]